MEKKDRELSALYEENMRLKSDIGRLGTQQQENSSSLEDKVKQSDLRIQEVEKEIAILETAKEALKSEKEALEQEIKLYRDRETLRQTELEKLLKEKQELENKLKEQEDIGNKTIRAEFEEEKKTLRAEKEQLEQMLRVQALNISEKETQLQKKEDAIREREEQMKQQGEEQQINFKKELDQLRTENIAEKQERERLTKELDERKALVTNIESSLSSQRHEHEKLQAELNTLYETLERERAEKSQEKLLWEAEFAKKNQELEDLRKAQELLFAQGEEGREEKKRNEQELCHLKERLESVELEKREREEMIREKDYEIKRITKIKDHVEEQAKVSTVYP